jgi:hypothetical protein
METAEINNRKLENQAAWAARAISTAVFIFLALLANKINSDLGMSLPDRQETFATENEAVAATESLYQKALAHNELYAQRLANIEQAMKAAEESYALEKKSLDNWTEARKATGDIAYNPELSARAEALDQMYKQQQKWINQRALASDELRAAENKTKLIYQKLDNQQSALSLQMRNSEKARELRLFLLRLIFAIPVLALGIYLFAKHRRNTYWPILRGFSLFAVYVFFVGLVPYLPSYGGYVRLAVGAAVSISLGYYAIKKMNAYMARKHKELEESASQRSLLIKPQVAEKALDAHICPSCGKDFLQPKWLQNNKTELAELPGFCVHCGMKLFCGCASCGIVKFAHSLFCRSCGIKEQRPQ